MPFKIVVTIHAACRTSVVECSPHIVGAIVKEVARRPIKAEEQRIHLMLYVVATTFKIVRAVKEYRILVMDIKCSAQYKIELSVTVIPP